MTECSICGLRMIHEGEECGDGQLLHCGDGHVAMVSCCSETDPHVQDAELASEWVARLGNAREWGVFFDGEQAVIDAVRALERRLGEAVTRQDDTQEVCRPGTQELADAAVRWVDAIDARDKLGADRAGFELFRLARAYAESGR